MIVKNESKIIERLLESVAPWIDCFCICDTGSTDDTMDKIQTFCESRQIPGRIFQEPFCDFGYNRALALRECDAMMTQPGDYILLLDADMIFWVKPGCSKTDFMNTLNGHAAVCILQGTDQFNYKNTRIVKANIGATYWGVTHEYVQLPGWVGAPPTLQKSDVFIVDVGDGGAKADKFERDIRLLKQGLEDNPDNVRYTFYLANSLRDAGHLDEAIVMYDKRVALGGWFEEVWYSYYSKGHIYMRQTKPEMAIYSWMQAYQCFPERVENLYEITHFYRTRCHYVAAQAYYAMAKKRCGPMNASYLFMQRDVYDYKLDYEMTVAGFYCNPDGIDLAQLSMKVLAYPALSASLACNVLANYKYYAPKLQASASVSSTYFNASFFEALQNGCKSPLSDDDDGFHTSTPTLAGSFAEGGITVLVRKVNYRIDDGGKYICPDKIVTRNVCTRLIVSADGLVLDTPTVLAYDESYDARYVGIEDVRLFTDGGGTVKYSGNRVIKDGDAETHVIEIGHLDGQALVKTHHLTSAFHRVEKNWVWATGTHMIYAWHPVTVGRPGDVNFEITHERSTPAWFKHVRGSSSGVRIDDELWFLCHVVSYESRRHYYHLVVVLDAATFELKWHTRLFTFTGSKVEYALGFIYHAFTDEFLVGYSVMDRSTEFMVLPRLACIAQKSCGAMA
jgi:glycosyltransferase involved in cell wall biosynthesis